MGPKGPSPPISDVRRNVLTPQQQTLLKALSKAPAPLPLVEADASGVSRHEVLAWLSQPEFSAAYGKIRAKWVKNQLELLADADQRAAPRIKWLLSTVDPDTFDPKTSAKAKPTDRRQNAHPGRKLNLEDQEKPEP